MKKILLLMLLVLTAVTSWGQATDSLKPFINQLEEGEHFSILVYSRGCFYSQSDSLLIYKTASGYRCHYDSSELELNNQHIEAIREFEWALMNLKAYGCTSVDYYTLTYNGVKREAIDGGCGWNGYSLLKKALGIKQD